MPSGVYERTKPVWNKGLKNWMSEESKASMVLKKSKYPSWNKGLSLTEEHKEKLRQSKLNKPTRYWLGKRRDAETIEKMSKNKIGTYYGEMHHNWKGGVTTENKKLRRTSSWIKWRKEVFSRDSYTCQECKLVGGFLHPHHIFQVKDCIETNQKHLIYDVNNGITLCKKCHIELHRLNKGGKELCR